MPAGGGEKPMPILAKGRQGAEIRVPARSDIVLVHLRRKRWAEETVIGGIDPKAWNPGALAKASGTRGQGIGPAVIIWQVIHPPTAPAGHIHDSADFGGLRAAKASAPQPPADWPSTTAPSRRIPG